MDIAEIISLAQDYEQSLPPAPAPLAIPEGRQIAAWIDHTLLKPDATPAQVRTLCQEAMQYHFASVCINPVYIPLACGLMKDAPEAICSVVAFPLGAVLPEIKVYETLACLSAGAAEIDMVINIGALKSEAFGLIMNEIQAVAQTAHNQGAMIKVILETALLTRREKILACLLSKAAGADFVKTSTGFGTGGATVEDVELMRRVVGADMGVKAAGGIRTCEDLKRMVEAGATRIGTSAGVAIVEASRGVSG